MGEVCGKRLSKEKEMRWRRYWSLCQFTRILSGFSTLTLMGRDRLVSHPPPLGTVSAIS